MNPSTNATGYVYVIHAVGANRIKIGYSATPEARMAQLQTGSSVTLEILVKMRGRVQDERLIHEYLAQFRKIGEWFEVPPFTVGYQIWQILSQPEALEEASQSVQKAQKLRLPEQVQKSGTPRYKCRKSGKLNHPVGYEFREASHGTTIYRIWRAYDPEQGKKRQYRKYICSINRANTLRLQSLPADEQLAEIRKLLAERG